MMKYFINNTDDIHMYLYVNIIALIRTMKNKNNAEELLKLLKFSKNEK